MNITEFILYIMNRVSNLNAFYLKIRNKNYEKNKLGPWINVKEKDIEITEGNVVAIDLPVGYNIVKEDEVNDNDPSCNCIDQLAYFKAQDSDNFHNKHIIFNTNVYWICPAHGYKKL